MVADRPQPLLASEPTRRRGRLRLRVQVRQGQVHGGRGRRIQPRMRRRNERGELRGDRVGCLTPTRGTGFVQHTDGDTRPIDRRQQRGEFSRAAHRPQGVREQARAGAARVTAASNSMAAARTAATSTIRRVDERPGVIGSGRGRGRDVADGGQRCGGHRPTSAIWRNIQQRQRESAGLGASSPIASIAVRAE